MYLEFDTSEGTSFVSLTDIMSLSRKGKDLIIVYLDKEYFYKFNEEDEARHVFDEIVSIFNEHVGVYTIPKEKEEGSVVEMKILN